MKIASVRSGTEQKQDLVIPSPHIFVITLHRKWTEGTCAVICFHGGSLASEDLKEGCTLISNKQQVFHLQRSQKELKRIYNKV